MSQKLVKQLHREAIESFNVFVFNLIGKGLTLVNSVIEGKYMERFNDAQTAKQVSS